MPRRAKTLKQRILGFLEDYRETCCITDAAKKNGIDRRQHYRWLQTKPLYAALFRETQAIAAEYLESELIKRASRGWLEPVFYQGAKCGSVRRYDGATGMALLRGLMPERYGNRTEISGPQGQPIQARIEVVFVKPQNDADHGVEPGPVS